MEYSENEPPTPYFGNSKDNMTLFEEFLGRRLSKSARDISQYIKNLEKHKSKNHEKSKEKKKNKSKNKKSKHKSSKPKKKKVSGKSLPTEQKYENPFDIFLKKKIELRNDFDQNNSEKFLSEKESAFEKFQMNENADYLDN